MNLVLFTSTYPFDDGAEQTFLEAELHHLCQSFERVILVPKKNMGRRLPVPPKAEVDESYALLLGKANLLSLSWDIFSSKLLYRELLQRPWLLVYPNSLKRMIRFFAVAKLTSSWIQAWLKENSGEDSTVFYTYWFDSSTFGIGLAKQQYPTIKAVSRAHGYDLYEEYHYKPPYWPFRSAVLSSLEALFPDSEAGLKYLVQRYPQYSPLYETALLGVTDPGFVTPASSDNVFRIISCSMLVPVKRVELIMEGILYASQMRPNQKFEWHHIGNGQVREALQEKANNSFPANASAFFPGYTNKDTLMRFYCEHPADVFINASSTEGTPVAVMEAISCGIPVIATAVGGNQEIVSEKNGTLLNPDPTPEEIAKAIFAFIDHPERTAEKRQGSRAVWMELYNADVNFHAFAKRLKSMGER